jgi:hypothetical protein
VFVDIDDAKVGFRRPERNGIMAHVDGQFSRRQSLFSMFDRALNLGLWTTLDLELKFEF